MDTTTITHHHHRASTVARWRARLEEMRSQGLSADEYCRAPGCCCDLLVRWARELGYVHEAPL